MRKIFLFVTGFFFSFSAFADNTIKISKVEANPFSVRANDKDILYSTTFGGMTIGVNQSDLMPIVRYLGLKTPEDLSGHSFLSPLRDPGAALDRLRLEAINKGHYTPPTPDQFFDNLAKGLADAGHGGCPDLHNFADSNTIAESMRTAIDQVTPTLKPGFLESFQSKISRYSNGTMNLVVSKEKSVNGVSFQSGTEYFELQSKGQSVIKFSIAAGSNGFMCKSHDQLKPATEAAPAATSVAK